VNKDGSYTLEFPYSDERELLGDILRYGADVEVLSPKSLRTNLQKAVEKTLKLYQ
jgi:predicted DNA-binding transcriptional regulator YafY